MDALRPDDLPQALALSQALNWPYRLEDWQAALELGRGLAVGSDGRLRATALWWPWGEAFATCGMIIVADAMQRTGIGALIMDELLAEAAGRSVILRSTEAGLRLYERLGFRPFGRVHQHQAALSAAPGARLPAPVRPMAAGDLETIRAIDRRGSGLDRARLLDALAAAGSVAVVERAATLTGYGIARRWGRGIVIGPVVAATADDATALIAFLAARHVGAFVRIDVTESSGLSPWLESQGLPCVDRVTSMVRGTLPSCAADATLFALSSQSLG
ncbi:MAG: GNAT family N-acetyltransferase [Steroidobacteraceae bacterium]